jgi:hypothetical protein
MQPILSLRISERGVEEVGMVTDRPSVDARKLELLERIAPALRDFDAAIKRAQAAKSFAK